MTANQRIVRVETKDGPWRTLNHTAVLDEKKRGQSRRVRGTSATETNEQVKQRREEEEIEGMDPENYLLTQTAEQVERIKKKLKFEDNNPHNRFAQNMAIRYEQNVNDIKISEEEYVKKHQSAEFYPDADSLLRHR